MTQKEFILAQLNSVRGELNETLPRLSDALLPYAPLKGMRTIQGQFAEIIATEVTIVNKISPGEEETFDEIESGILNLGTLSEVQCVLDETRKRTLYVLQSLSDDELTTGVQVSKGFGEWLGILGDVPISELFRHIARHESYHAGQIVSYLWARGDDPYSWS